MFPWLAYTVMSCRPFSEACHHLSHVGYFRELVYQAMHQWISVQSAMTWVR